MQRLVRLPSLSPLWREYVFPGRFQRASRTSQTPELPVLGGETRERDSKSSRKCSSMIVSWRAGCRCGFGFMVIPPSPSIHRRGFVWRDELTMSAWFVLNASVIRLVQRALIVEPAREVGGTSEIRLSGQRRRDLTGVGGFAEARLAAVASDPRRAGRQDAVEIVRGEGHDFIDKAELRVHYPAWASRTSGPGSSCANIRPAKIEAGTPSAGTRSQWPISGRGTWPELSPS
jgi:hypothetical protein